MEDQPSPKLNLYTLNSYLHLMQISIFIGGPENASLMFLGPSLTRKDDKKISSLYKNASPSISNLRR